MINEREELASFVNVVITRDAIIPVLEAVFFFSFFFLLTAAVA